MDKILQQLTKDGYYNVSEVRKEETSDIIAGVRFVLDRKYIDMAYVEFDNKLNFPLKYISYSEDKKLFYDAFKNLSKKARITIMQDLWRKYGEYNIMLALRKYSTDSVCDYGKYLFSFIFIRGDSLFSDKTLDDLFDKPNMDKSLFIAVIKDLSFKLKGNN